MLFRSVRRRETTRLWTIKNRERIRMKDKQRPITEKSLARIKQERFIRRFRKRGLTVEQYCVMLKEQDGRCAICGVVPADNYGGSHDGFHIDHHHVTNRVRGLLCKHCNVGIGMLKDSSEICAAAAAYLSRLRP